jgi:hypothetical protein
LKLYRVLILGFEGKMNRSELATEFNIYPWDVDDWLLWGCPAKRVRSLWEFDLEKVRNWLEMKKIKVHRIRRRHSYKKPVFNLSWVGDRCPICIERGFAGQSAGRVYTMGEVLEGEWHLRRTGIPCGHSIFLPHIRILRASAGKGRQDESRKGE